MSSTKLKQRAQMLLAAVALTALALAALPSVAEAQERSADATVAAQQQQQPALEEEPAPEQRVIVVVKPGDSLWAIAQGHLGPEATPKEVYNEVGRIYELNRERIGDDPDLIFPGQEFRLPSINTLGEAPAATEPPAAAPPVSVEAPAATPETALPEPAAPPTPQTTVVTAAPVQPANEPAPTTTTTTNTAAPEQQPQPANKEFEQPQPAEEEPPATNEPAPPASDNKPSSSEPDNSARRTIGSGILVLTLAVVALMVWRLPMKRHGSFGEHPLGGYYYQNYARLPHHEQEQEQEERPETEASRPAAQAAAPAAEPTAPETPTAYADEHASRRLRARRLRALRLRTHRRSVDEQRFPEGGW